MKVIDISHNRISNNCLKNIVIQSLRENISLVNFDVRFNTGVNSSLMKQVSLCMLKNISVHQRKDLTLKNSWLDKRVIYHADIPEKIYAGLNLSMFQGMPGSEFESPFKQWPEPPT